MLHKNSLFQPANQKKIHVLTSSDIDELALVALQTRYETYSDCYTLAELEKFYDERFRASVRQELTDKNILYTHYTSKCEV